MARKTLCNVLVLLTFGLATTGTLLGCDRTSFSATGVNQPMKTYYIGRFSVDIPASLDVTSGATFRDLKITETPWPEGMDRAQAREMEWNRFLEKLAQKNPPDDKESVILKNRDFPELGDGAKGIFYYYRDLSSRTAKWKVMMDSGRYAVWLESSSTTVDFEQKTNAMADHIAQTGQAYREIADDRARAHLRDGWFHLERNAIHLPYFFHESAGAGATNADRSVELSIELESDKRRHYSESPIPTRKTVREFKDLMSGMDVRISIVRYGEREVAGMRGGEFIFRGWEDGEESIHFIWEYNGVYDTGEYPAIKIKMEGSDGRWKEKIALWDAILDSMQPMFERK
jgi:hypothetical protein